MGFFYVRRSFWNDINNNHNIPIKKINGMAIFAKSFQKYLHSCLQSWDLFISISLM